MIEPCRCLPRWLLSGSPDSDRWSTYARVDVCHSLHGDLMHSSAPTPPPGWYTDPRDARLLRYWDGTAWTAHTAPVPHLRMSPAVQATRMQAQPGRGASARVPWWGVVTAVVVALLLLLVGVVSVVVSGDDSPVESAQPSSSAEPATVEQSPSEAADTEAAASPEPEPRSTVPSLVGLDGAEARRKLAASGLVAIVASRVPSARPVATVLRQSKRAGKSVLEGSTIALVLAAPYPAVPGTAGMTQAAAIRTLRAAGFRVHVSREVVSSGRNGVVLRQTPVGSTRVKPHSVITVVVASLVRPVAAPQPAATCTSGYSPCLAPASDYDCAGGSGDGPRYTGYVTVTGSDPYDLDADGDGVACES